jgi:glycosyltransferase involved in cell wall biosynthesis
MKILLSNHSLAGVGGTEKWTYAMALELKRQGHEVDVFCFMPGVTSGHLENAGIGRDLSEDGYDLKIINGNTCLETLKDVKGFTVFTSHGPKHMLEHAAYGADAYVGVSPEVVARMSAFDKVGTVIYNGIDLKEFAPHSWDDDTPRVLSLCKSVATSWMLSDACKKLGWEYTWVNYRERMVWDIANVIKPHSIVVGCGRSAIEGLACGKRVLVFDGRTEEPRADGWVTADNVEQLRQKNFSCRTHNFFWDVETLTTQLAQFPTDTQWMRPWVMENADIRHKADQYLNLIGGQNGNQTNSQARGASVDASIPA